MIRPYQEEDNASVIEMIKLLTPKYFDPSEEELLEKYLKQPDKNCFVKVEDGMVMALCGYRIEGDKGLLTWCLTDPKSHGKGYGTELVNFCKAQLQKDSKITKWDVWTSQFGDSFFARFGFETKIIQHNFWGQGLDLYLMTSTLEE